MPHKMLISFRMTRIKSQGMLKAAAFSSKRDHEEPEIKLLIQRHVAVWMMAEEDYITSLQVCKIIRLAKCIISPV